MKKRLKIVILIFWAFTTGIAGLFLCPFWLILWGITGWSYVPFFDTQTERVNKLLKTLEINKNN